MENEILIKILDKLEQLEQKVDAGLGSLGNEVGSLRDEVGSLHGEVGSLRDEVGSLHGEVGSLRGEVGSLRDEVGSLHGEVGSLRGEVGSLHGEMNERFEKVEATLNRIEISQQEDIISVIRLMDTKLEDTAKKSDIDSLRQDIEFTVKENSLFKLELDRLKRNAYE